MAQATYQRPQRTAAFAGGLVAFGAVMLVIGGILDVLRGVMAIAEDDIIVNTPDYVFKFDTTGWGWIHLSLGVLAVVVGASLFQARTWARVVGVVLAGLLLISSFLTLPYYPVWSVVLIAVYGFIIWALCVVQPREG
ncbi:hypothetical protein G5C60_44450 [Streptomyces sp. HC44]|uniref:DUF7144 domain-containing protein n=1 Tax=Streptomyces scabichelini TaxID=2711217 RepID=A0A6G4VKZ1_9ACTN|nr:hypothetical protein [Streptomyces scabichelini]NGO14460.1 hypothetical protein [Streptomyces scabichelini]